jgi:hypothetical protein
VKARKVERDVSQRAERYADFRGGEQNSKIDAGAARARPYFVFVNDIGHQRTGQQSAATKRKACQEHEWRGDAEIVAG